MLRPYDFLKILNSGRYILFFVFLWILSCFVGEGFFKDLSAASLIKKVDGIELNWSTSRFRSSGEGKIEEFSTSGINSSDAKAWNNGIVNIGEDAKKLVAVLIPGVNVSQADLAKLEKSVKSSSYTVNTEYYGTSGIRVVLENRISRIYKLMNLSFLAKDKGVAAPKNTGIILQLSSKMEPVGVYTVQDGAGNILFSSSSVYEEAFDYNTMGKWFNSSSKYDISKVVGDNPVTVKVDIKDSKMVVSDMEQWNVVTRDNFSLLANAKIAVVIE